MLGADARLLTEGEEIKSHDLFARLNSKKIITGEDGDEESELEYLGEIREVRDKQPEPLRPDQAAAEEGPLNPIALPTRTAPCTAASRLCSPTFGMAAWTSFTSRAALTEPVELDFLAAVKLLKPADKRRSDRRSPPTSTTCWTKNKAAFAAATSPKIG